MLIFDELGLNSVIDFSLTYLYNECINGTSGIAHYQCKQLLGGRYHRLAPCFAPGKAYPMDDVKHVGEMVTFAQTLNLDETIAWLKAQWI